MDFTEREIKLYIRDLPSLAERLRVCGADLTRPRTLEINLRLDTSDNSLKINGRLLRLRKDDRARVTYKENARVENGIIARTEIEFTTDDFEVTRKLFEALGYQCVVVYEKFRQVFRLGDVEVSLDELPFGDFIEIEAPNNTLIEGTAQMLRLDWSLGIETNYLGLFEILKMNTAIEFNDPTFDNFQGIEVSASDLNLTTADY